MRIEFWATIAYMFHALNILYICIEGCTVSVQSTIVYLAPSRIPVREYQYSFGPEYSMLNPEQNKSCEQSYIWNIFKYWYTMALENRRMISTFHKDLHGKSKSFIPCLVFQKQSFVSIYILFLWWFDLKLYFMCRY